MIEDNFDDVVKKSLMPRRGPCSRDWYESTIKCRCNKCICNSGNGECAVPSKIQLDINGQCIVGKRYV